MTNTDTVFELVEAMEQEVANANDQKEKLLSQVNGINNQLERLRAELNFFTGVQQANVTNTEKLLKNNGVTFEEYILWKQAKDAPPNETGH